MRGAIAALVRSGARPLLLAGFHGRMPSEAEARNLGSWAAAFGTGGSFWAEHRRHRLPVRLIEFGNETSYGHQYGDAYSDQSYHDRAELYATRFAQAHSAIARRHRHVGLLAQADDGGTASPVWVTHMFGAVPKLGTMVAGWTVHPYGPRERWEPKLHRLIAQTAAMGARASIPIDVTEYGISSDDGAGLTDNYGWPTDLTYAQAAEDLRSTVDRDARRRQDRQAPAAVHDLLGTRPAAAGRNGRPRGLLRGPGPRPVRQGRVHGRGAAAAPLDVLAHLEPAGPDLFHQRLVVALVLVRVGLREVGDRSSNAVPPPR